MANPTVRFRDCKVLAIRKFIVTRGKGQALTQPRQQPTIIKEPGSCSNRIDPHGLPQAPATPLRITRPQFKPRARNHQLATVRHLAAESVPPNPQVSTPDNPPMSLRHIVITGGSRGIGLAIAQLFAKNNYRCTLISRNEESLKAAINTLPPIYKPSGVADELVKHRYIVGDISNGDFWNHANAGNALTLPAQSIPGSEVARQAIDDAEEPKWEMKRNKKREKEEEEEHAALLRSGLESMGREDMEVTASPNRLSAKFGPESETEPELESKVLESDDVASAERDRKCIDVLVNCAGITDNKLFAGGRSSTWKGVINTNLTGLMIGTQYLLRNRFLRPANAKEDYSPTIINVASLLAVQGGFGAVAYAASKAGVLGFTRALALETGRFGVRVNAIVPGYIETDMISDLNPAALSRRVPLNRLGRPSEIADTALFLARNQYAHNCVINIDGGLSGGAL